MSNKLTIHSFHNLSAISGIKHGIVDRIAGFSTGIREGLNLGEHVGDDPDLVLKNRQMLANEIGTKSVIFPNQVHGNKVQIWEDGQELQDTDGIITAEPNLCIGVLTADCVPIVLYDPDKHISAVLHAGWRGTVGNIGKKAVDLMVSRFKSKPKNILAGIGPSISARNYEVGNEVITAVDELLGPGVPVISNRGNGKGHLDLWLLNKILLMQSGLKQDHIEVMGTCTFENKSFFSARRDGINTGRFATFIMNC